MTDTQAIKPAVYGLIAEFDSPSALLASARKAYAAGYRKMDAYSPFPIHGLAEALGMKGTHLGYLVFLGGLFGGLAGFGMQYFASVIHYPMNVGGRPLNSWPSFIPVTFELTVLGAALTAVFGMLALNGLPMPYHPVFNVERFAFASRDHFYLCLESKDPLFRASETKSFLESLKANAIFTVEP